MWPHMNNTRTRPVALWVRSSRAGQRLLRARSRSPTPAISELLCCIVRFLFRVAAGLDTLFRAESANLDLRQSSQRQCVHVRTLGLTP